jgi:hypothetical protein
MVQNKKPSMPMPRSKVTVTLVGSYRINVSIDPEPGVFASYSMMNSNGPVTRHS